VSDADAIVHSAYRPPLRCSWLIAVVASRAPLAPSGFRQAAIAGTLRKLSMKSFDGTTGDTAHPSPSLVAGDYDYHVTGLATGSFGAFYSIVSLATPIPKPASA
jgi:hypothetical protein